MTDQETPEAPTEAPETQITLNEAKDLLKDETVSMPKAEADALRRRLAEAEKAQRRLEGERKKAEEKSAEEQGKWQEIAQQREKELAETQAQVAKAEREQRVTRLASKLKFIDPGDVVGAEGPEERDVPEVLAGGVVAVGQVDGAAQIGGGFGCG